MFNNNNKITQPTDKVAHQAVRPQILDKTTHPGIHNPFISFKPEYQYSLTQCWISKTLQAIDEGTSQFTHGATGFMFHQRRSLKKTTNDEENFKV